MRIKIGKGNRVKVVYMNSLFLGFLSVEREIPLTTLLRKTYFAEFKKKKKMGKKEKLLRNLQTVNEALIRHIQYREWILQALAEGRRTSAGESQHRKLELIERRIRKDTGLKQDIEAILASEYGHCQ